MADQFANYLDESRLRDVMALIQVLGYGEHPSRAPNGICVALQDVNENHAPTQERMDHWEEVARGHPEFFRVSGDGVSISLVARFVDAPPRPPRTPEVVWQLMQTAISLHDREAQHRDRWATYFPLLIAVVGAVGSVLTAIIGLLAAKR